MKPSNKMFSYVLLKLPTKLLQSQSNKLAECLNILAVTIFKSINVYI